MLLIIMIRGEEARVGTGGKESPYQRVKESGIGGFLQCDLLIITFVPFCFSTDLANLLTWKWK